MSKFLLVSARHGEEILASEYRDFLVSSGLMRSELDHQILDSPTSSVAHAESYDGIFIGGSPFNVTDPEFSAEQDQVHSELRKLADSDIPSMFVCFGSSILTHLYNGVVDRANPEAAGPTVVELTAAAQDDPLLHSIPRRFTALTGHTESVATLPPDAVLLATGPHCPVQMFRLGDHTWASQFHSEMDPPALEIRMRFYLDHGYFDPNEFDEIVANIKSVDTGNAHQVLRNFVAYCR